MICLDGVLGAGKTVLAQGVAQGLGIVEAVTSPTFTLLKEYRGRLVLNHFDFYRLEGTDREPPSRSSRNTSGRSGGLRGGVGGACPGLRAAASICRSSCAPSARPSAPCVLAAHGEHYEELVRRFQRLAFR